MASPRLHQPQQAPGRCGNGGLPPRLAVLSGLFRGEREADKEAVF